MAVKSLDSALPAAANIIMNTVNRNSPVPSILSARDFGFSCVVSACINYISVVLHEKSILNSVVIYKVIIAHLPGKCNPFTNISRVPATFSPPARYYIQKHPGKEHV